MQHVKQNLIVVEDEPIIAMMIEDLAQELGWTVEGSAHTEAEAFGLLNSCSPQLALLDINLGLTTSLAVASSCRDRRIPVVFMTGYCARDVPIQCGDAPILAKPFSPDDLERALRRALAKVPA
jgi:CheY-like chemotaxis protein